MKLQQAQTILLGVCLIFLIALSGSAAAQQQANEQEYPNNDLLTVKKANGEVIDRYQVRSYLGNGVYQVYRTDSAGWVLSATRPITFDVNRIANQKLLIESRDTPVPSQTQIPPPAVAPARVAPTASQLRLLQRDTQNILARVTDSQRVEEKDVNWYYFLPQEERTPTVGPQTAAERDLDYYSPENPPPTASREGLSTF